MTSSLARRPLQHPQPGRTPAVAVTIMLTVGIAPRRDGRAWSASSAPSWSIRCRTPIPARWSGSTPTAPPFRFRFSVVDYRALEAGSSGLQRVAAYQRLRVTVSDGGVAERVTAKAVTGSYFPLLGQRPHIGRLFDPSDDARGEPVAVLTYAYWTRRFGERPVGRRPNDHDRWRELRDRRRAAAERRARSSTTSRVHRGALAASHAQGTVLHDGRSAALRPGVSQRRGARDAARDQRAALSDLAVVVPGRKGHVGPAWISRRASSATSARRSCSCWRRSAACCSSRAPTPSTCWSRARSRRSRELAIRGALGASRGRLLQHLSARRPRC